VVIGDLNLKYPYNCVFVFLIFSILKWTKVNMYSFFFCLRPNFFIDICRNKTKKILKLQMSINSSKTVKIF